VGLREVSLSVVDPHVAVNIEEAEGGSSQGNPTLGKRSTERDRLLKSREA
jgi:hypothetical protein